MAELVEREALLARLAEALAAGGQLLFVGGEARVVRPDPEPVAA
jgi:hypothetical protein